MNDIMKPSNTFLITLKDWVFDPEGPNGGGENATRSVAEELAKMGYRVIVAGNLAGPERKILGVEYWQLGPAYDLHSLMQRTKEIGIFDLLAVERATSLVAFHKYPLCRNRYLYYHGPTADAAGLQFSTCSLNADRIFCVSKAQKERLLQGGADESKVQVLRNAVDTTLFRFEDFSQRDPFKLVFAGVLIFEKGIHVLLNIFPRLKEIFPQLTLDVYGRKGGWTLIDNNISQMEQGIPGLKFKGEVPQATLAQAFQKAAVCVIPSTSFETCSLVSIDAQACGCPVVAFGMGAIPEFIHDGRTGVVIKEVSEQQLFENLRLLLSNPDKLREMNRECRELAGKRTWTDVAKELLSGVEQVRKQELVTVHAEDAAPRITAVNQPYFSVVIPCYNHAHFLTEALNSLMQQSYPNWEALIVDDGSRDNSEEVARQLIQVDQRIKYFKKENGGTGSALNLGIEHMRYDWFAWLSSDDLYAQNKLEHFASAISSSPSERFFHSAFYFLDHVTGVQTPAQFNQPPSIALQSLQFYYENPVNGNTVVIHRGIFDEVGKFDTTYRHAQDFEMWLRISKVAALVYLPQHLAVTRCYPEQVSNVKNLQCIFDSARAVLSFCSRWKLIEQVPFADPKDPQAYSQVLRRAVDIIVSPHAFMYRGVGFSKLHLLRRLIEFVNESSDDTERQKFLMLLGQLSEKLGQLNGMEHFAAAMRSIISAGGTCKCDEFNPIDDMRQFLVSSEEEYVQGEKVALAEYLSSPLLKQSALYGKNLEISSPTI